ncbi:MAG: DNA methyltransferase, partial [Propionibacteriaceae bacterium]
MYSGLQGVAPYPTMAFEELAALPIRELADPRGCALFLWATGPLMDRAIGLMEA